MRACARADELRRRSRLRNGRADRPVRDAAMTRSGAPVATSACVTPATTRSTRCASKPVAAPGVRNCRRMKRRWRPGSATPSSSTSRCPSSDATRCCGSRPKACASGSCCSRSTIPPAFPWGGEPILMDGRNVGELTSAGYSRKFGRAIAMGYARTDPDVPPLYGCNAGRRALRGRHRGAHVCSHPALALNGVRTRILCNHLPSKSPP